MRAIAAPLPLPSACLLAGLLVPAAPLAAQTDFQRPVYETGGGAATGFAYGDIDGDGRADAAVVHAVSDTLGLLFARPGGGFDPPVLLPTGDGPSDVAIADFDLDARPDVVVLNQAAGTLTLVLRKATGTEITTWPAGGNGYVLAVGDLDDDGDPDVVTGLYDQSALSVVLGLGAAGLAAPVTYPVGARPLALVLEDFDGDGALDVASANVLPSTLTLRPGDGLGGLGSATTLATPASTGGLVAADLDGDGDTDLATGSGDDLMLLRNGPGGFDPPETTPMGAGTTVVAAADLDDDGPLDLLIRTKATPAPESLRRVPGLGGGTFGPPVTVLSTTLYSIAVADADDDGRLDVLGLLSGQGGGLGLLRGDGAGGLLGSKPVSIAEDTVLHALADLDGDGTDDLVSAGPSGLSAGPAWVQLGDGTGGFGPPQGLAFGAAGFLVLADVTGDGTPDLLTTTPFTASDIVFAAGDGAGGFATPTTIPMPTGAARALAAADLDADGDVDLAVLGETGGFMGTEARSLINFQNEGAGQWSTWLVGYDVATQFDPTDALALGDCNGDDEPDAVVLNRASGLLVYFAGPGGGPPGLGWFGEPSYLGPAPSAGGAQPIGLADLDHDGAADVVVAGTSVQVWYGHGDGEFDAPQTLGDGPGHDLRWVDVDGDGDEELLMGGSSVVMVWHADGRGGFVRNRYFTETAQRAFVTDADGDGRVDVLTLPADSSASAPVPYDGHLLRNHTLLAAWADLGFGLPGTFGVPVLTGLGTLAPGSPGSLTLSEANPDKLAVLFVSPLAQPTPFKGGLLLPVPPTIVFTLMTDGAGSIALSWASWTAMPPGTDWFFQYGVVDAAGPAGASLSNALRALQP